MFIGHRQRPPSVKPCSVKDGSMLPKSDPPNVRMPVTGELVIDTSHSTRSALVNDHDPSGHQH